jgi:hypothetical protein
MMRKQVVSLRKQKKKKHGMTSEFIGNIHKADGTGVRKIDLDRIFSLQRIFETKHHVVLTPITQAANAASNGAIIHTIGDINDSAGFLAIFDEYQIWGVKTQFLARQNAMPLAAASNPIPGYLTTALDFDDSNSVPIASLQDYNTAVTVPAWENVVRIYRPKISVATYGAGVVTNYTQITPDNKIGWSDNADSGIVHNGCKWAIRAGAVAQTLLSVWDIECTYYVRWRMSF